ncbi:TerC family protein [Roseomonas elaeocarpi]|uniref:TerC family protein n=1 Tax=Roseomonas elaeocarpi TaxID=907779 RepID=A0ABV6JV56_9PROT
MEASIWFWVVFNAAVLLVLLFDLGVFSRKKGGEPEAVPVRTALLKSGVYLLLALGFFAWLRMTYGATPEERATKSFEFLTGYLIEWSLSVDNIFVFVLLFAKFGVPAASQHRVLFWGILGALVMRALMILVGTALVREFDWVMVVFALFLIWSGWKMLRSSHEADDGASGDEGAVMRWMRRRLPVTEGYRGNRFAVREAGRFLLTPLALVLVAVELTDLLFALDSIPAIFAVSTDPFIVYTANVFAILGLRAMYFALAGVIHRFRYLKHGLSIVLMIVGAKMLANWYAGGKAVPVEAALAVTAVIIAGSVALSLWKTRGEGKAVGGA